MDIVIPLFMFTNKKLTARSKKNFVFATTFLLFESWKIVDISSGDRINMKAYFSIGKMPRYELASVGGCMLSPLEDNAWLKETDQVRWKTIHSGALSNVGFEVRKAFVHPPDYFINFIALSFSDCSFFNCKIVSCAYSCLVSVNEPCVKIYGHEHSVTVLYIFKNSA